MSETGLTYSQVRKERFERQRAVPRARVVSLGPARIRNRTPCPWNMGYMAALHRISVHYRRTEMSTMGLSRMGRMLTRFFLLGRHKGRYPGCRSAVRLFSPASSGLILTGMAHTPVPPSICSPNPFSSLTRTNIRRSPTLCTVSNAESRGYISSQADLNHKPQLKFMRRDRGDLPVFEAYQLRGVRVSVDPNVGTEGAGGILPT